MADKPIAEPDVVVSLLRDRMELIEAGLGNFMGCYAVFNSSDVCLYVGRSKAILTRVMSHWIDQQDGNGSQWRLAGTTEWYNTKPFAPCGSILKVWSEFNFEDLEISLINVLKPTHNTHFAYYKEEYELR
jgi:excinuclease UvrABC nuclease subunit